jgi:hypothetical protein
MIFAICGRHAASDNEFIESGMVEKCGDRFWNFDDISFRSSDSIIFPLGDVSFQHEHSLGHQPAVGTSTHAQVEKTWSKRP